MIITKELFSQTVSKLLSRDDTSLSEAQLKYSLAWELRRILPQNYSIYLEYPIREQKDDGTETRKYHDIVIKGDGKFCVIELKYKTKAKDVRFDGKMFSLKTHGAQDLGRYDFLKDVERIEHYKKSNANFDCGYSVIITNDSVYWTREGLNKIYQSFALNEGRIIPNRHLDWINAKVESVGKSRENGLQIDGSYTIKWLPESSINDFRYLILDIK